MYGIREYLQACHYRKDFLQSQLEWLRSERKNFAKDAKRLDGVAERIRQEMVGYLIPEVHDDHIAALEKKLSYPGLSPIKRQYDALFDAAEKRRLELEAMDEIQHFDYRIDQAKEDVEDVRPAYDKMRSQLAPWENSKSFSRLNKRGYFQSDYVPGFFRRFFDWRDVSFLMAELSKQAGIDFKLPDQLRKHYHDVRDEAETIFAAFDTRVAEHDRIASLQAEHTETLQAPEKLLSELFRDLGKATIEHLDACPDDLRQELARGDQNLNAFLRKEVGTRKQIQYLRELSVTRIDANIQRVEQELNKINKKIKKLEMQRRRGKRKRFTGNDIARMKNVKADKWERRRAKTAKIRGKITEFDKHEHGSCAMDYLWWDLMTGGAMADDIFEVREFRRHHPDWDYRTYHDPTTGNLGIADGGQDVFDDAAEDLASSMMTPGDDVFSDPS